MKAIIRSSKNIDVFEISVFDLIAINRYLERKFSGMRESELVQYNCSLCFWVAESIFSFCWSDHSSNLIFKGTSYEDRQGARIEPSICSPNEKFN